MKTIKEIDEILDKYSLEKAYNTYSNIDKLRESGELKIAIESFDILDTIKIEMTKYLDLLFDKDGIYKNYPNIRALLLEKNEFLHLIDNYGYILSSYFGNEKVYRDFPEYFKLLIDELKIEEYKYKLPNDIEEALEDTVGLKIAYDIRYERTLKDIDFKCAGMYINYDKIVEKIENGKQIKVKSDEYWVWAEYQAYKHELSKMDTFGLSRDLVRWVSRYDGDGYGYDILTIDPVNYREKAVEVKSKSRDSEVFLNISEYEYIEKIDESSKVDYYLYVYRYDHEKKQVLPKYLKYYPTTGVFYNIDDTDEVYTVKTDGFESRIKNPKFQFCLNQVPREDAKTYLKNRR